MDKNQLLHQDDRSWPIKTKPMDFRGSTAGMSQGGVAIIFKILISAWLL